MKKFLSLLLTIIIIVCTMPMVFAKINTYKVGDIIQFGSYPQSEVKDEALIAELNALAPEWENWISYDYYSGNGDYGSMVQGDWMRYVDLIHNENKYRGVSFTKYRPASTIFSHEHFLHPQNSNGYYTNEVYWFVYEPIDWIVLDPQIGLIISKNSLDAQPINNTIYMEKCSDFLDNDISEQNLQLYYSDVNCTFYASDYKTSYIREWLNNSFLETSFSAGQQRRISETTLAGKTMVTLDKCGCPDPMCNYSIEKHLLYFDNMFENIVDKVFLLSNDDVLNTEYGFVISNDFETSIIFEDAIGTDYALSQGLSVFTAEKSSAWCLRTASSTNTCTGIGHSGYLYGGLEYITYTRNGIRPALCLRNITDLHECIFTTYISNNDATCIEDGTKIANCDYHCGDIDIIPDIDSKLGHHMNDYYTVTNATCSIKGSEKSDCSRCDYSEIRTLSILEHIDMNYDGICDTCKVFIADENCHCVCHSSGFDRFIYDLLLAVQKMFKINLLSKVFGLDWRCKCNIAHY